MRAPDGCQLTKNKAWFTPLPLMKASYIKSLSGAFDKTEQTWVTSKLRRNLTTIWAHWQVAPVQWHGLKGFAYHHVWPTNPPMNWMNHRLKREKRFMGGFWTTWLHKPGVYCSETSPVHDEFWFVIQFVPIYIAEWKGMDAEWICRRNKSGRRNEGCSLPV